MCLGWLIGQQNANALNFPESYFSNAKPTGDTACNPILFDHFSHLTVAEPFDDTRNRYLRNAFKHAVTQIAFKTINTSHREPLNSFGPGISQVSPEIITRIIDQVVERYAGKLWPGMVGMDPLPAWLIAALQEYIHALMEIPTDREGTIEPTLWFFDNLLVLNQDELQGGLANEDISGGLVEDAASVEDDGDVADDGLECVWKEMASFESCSTSFATAADLERHMIETHGYDLAFAREVVQEATITRKNRVARRS